MYQQSNIQLYRYTCEYVQLYLLKYRYTVLFYIIRIQIKNRIIDLPYIWMYIFVWFFCCSRLLIPWLNTHWYQNKIFIFWFPLFFFAGIFLIPYTCSLLIVGVPLFLAETAIAQYSQGGPFFCFHYCPIFRAVGLGMTMISLTIAMYYNVIIAWAFYYFFASMAPELPWSKCRDWSTIRKWKQLDN